YAKNYTPLTMNLRLFISMDITPNSDTKLLSRLLVSDFERQSLAMTTVFCVRIRCSMIMQLVAYVPRSLSL
ncbi:MAG: hypothetical protein NTU72_13590, partial [Fimbriimonadales bacterium]|nr:hypothetical protein [Fimbriimonadales bacterium]